MLYSNHPLTLAGKQMKEFFNSVQVDINRPIVFLDLCGVLSDTWLNTQSWAWSIDGMFRRRNNRLKGDSTISAAHDLLIGIFKQYKVQVIIVSSWVRAYQSSDTEEIVQLKEFLGYDEILGSLHTSGGSERGEIVKEFIIKKELDMWVVIDDSRNQMYRDRDFFNDGHFVHPNASYGFWLKEADELCQILDGFK